MLILRNWGTAQQFLLGSIFGNKGDSGYFSREHENTDPLEAFINDMLHETKWLALHYKEFFYLQMKSPS